MLDNDSDNPLVPELHPSGNAADLRPRSDCIAMDYANGTGRFAADRIWSKPMPGLNRSMALDPPGNIPDDPDSIVGNFGRFFRYVMGWSLVSPDRNLSNVQGLEPHRRTTP